MGFLKNILTSWQDLSALPQEFTVADLTKRFDVFYVCFDEPNKDENWLQIQKIISKAQKVEGVVGFDQALKTCARLSKTKHFFLIDGDNKLISNRLNNKIKIMDLKNEWVLSWSSLNIINGLSYGNGGVKLWPRKVALEIKTHENAEANQDQTDYCFIAKYFLINDYVSQTIVNKTPQQAFRAGFREGFKMSLQSGKQVELNWNNFNEKVVEHNRQRLKIWCEVGADIENGYWGILGARLGLKFNTIERLDYKVINSYQWIDKFFVDEVLATLELSNGENLCSESRQRLIDFIERSGQEINQRIPLDLRLLEPCESKDFKDKFKNPPRSGLLRV